MKNLVRVPWEYLPEPAWVPFDPNKHARRIDASDYGRFERTFQDLLEACEALVDAGGGGGACDGHDR